ncbi:hypothetical protein CF328_g5561 [Tilletia controversa]|nr:hypothetical protein CF328_g5561 [Tilletia controversa]
MSRSMVGLPPSMKRLAPLASCPRTAVVAPESDPSSTIATQDAPGGIGPACKIPARRRAIHLVEDRNQIHQAQQSGFPLSQLLLDAIELNDTTICAEDSDDSILSIISEQSRATADEPQFKSQTTDASSKVLFWQSSQASVQVQLEYPNHLPPAAPDSDAAPQDINWAFYDQNQLADDFGSGHARSHT